MLTSFSELLSGIGGMPSTRDVHSTGAIPFAFCGNRSDSPIADLEGMWRFVEDLGRMFGVADRARQVAEGYRARERALRERYAGAKDIEVLAVVGVPPAGQPLNTWAAGSSTNAVIELAGGRTLFAVVANLRTGYSQHLAASRDRLGDVRGNSATR